MKLNNLYSTLVLIGIILLRQGIASSGFFHGELFPSVYAITKKLMIIWTQWESGREDVIATLWRMVLGFSIALFFAVGAGLLIGSNKKLHNALSFCVNFFRSLPGTAMFPIFLLFFWIWDEAKVAIISFVSFRIILVNTIDGVKYASKTRMQVVKLFEIAAFQKMKLAFHEALPYIVVWAKTSLSIAFRVSIVSEMFVGSKTGIGQKVYDSYTLYSSDTMFARVLIAGIIGSLLASVSVYFEHKILFWKQPST